MIRSLFVVNYSAASSRMTDQKQRCACCLSSAAGAGGVQNASRSLNRAVVQSRGAVAMINQGTNSLDCTVSA